MVKRWRRRRRIRRRRRRRKKRSRRSSEDKTDGVGSYEITLSKSKEKKTRND